MEKNSRDKVKYLLADLEKTDPLPEDKFYDIVGSFDFQPPQSYLEVMKDFNSGEGEVGKDSWLLLFPFDELKEVNEKSYKYLMKDIPDYFLFGKDAADTGYAFHKTYATFHSFGLMSNFNTDPIELLGKDFVEFLEYLDDYRFGK